MSSYFFNLKQIKLISLKDRSLWCAKIHSFQQTERIYDRVTLPKR